MKRVLPALSEQLIVKNEVRDGLAAMGLQFSWPATSTVPGRHRLFATAQLSRTRQDDTHEKESVCCETSSSTDSSRGHT